MDDLPVLTPDNLDELPIALPLSLKLQKFDWTAKNVDNIRATEKYRLTKKSVK